jgi:hypothetical protein
MDSVTLYNVYEDGRLLASFKAQAPATSFAKNQSYPRSGSNKGRSLDVVEEVFGHVSSREVRKVIDGKAFKCS